MPEFTGTAMAGPVGMGARSAQYTGSYIVLLDPRHQKAALTALRSGAGLGDAQSAAASDVAGTAEALASGETIVFEEIGVAVVAAEPDQRQALARTAAESPNVLAMERERVVYAFDPLSPVVPEGLPRRRRITGGDRARRDSGRRPGWGRHHRRRRGPLYLGAAIDPRARVVVLRRRHAGLRVGYWRRLGASRPRGPDCEDRVVHRRVSWRTATATEPTASVPPSGRRTRRRCRGTAWRTTPRSSRARC